MPSRHLRQAVSFFCVESVTRRRSKLKLKMRTAPSRATPSSAFLSRSSPRNPLGRAWVWRSPAILHVDTVVNYSFLGTRLIQFSFPSHSRPAPATWCTREQNPDRGRRTEYAQDSGVKSGSG